MNNTERKLGKTDTRNLLRHATARSSTKTVAALLGVADARISEGKSGRWQLSGENAAKLREEFGTPQAEAGLFLECEVWDTLQDLQADSDNVARWRQWQRVMAVIRHPNLQRILASLVSPDQNAGEARVHETLGSLLQDEEFISWYHNAKLTLSDAKAGSRGWPRNISPLSLSSKVLSEGGMKITDILIRHGFIPELEWRSVTLMQHSLTLILLGELACKNQEISDLTHHSEGDFQPFVTPWPYMEAPERAFPRETVITGDVIWRRREWIEPSVQPEALLPLEGLPDMTSWLTSNEYELTWLTGILPDQFNHLDLQVVMTKHLNYHLVITLSLQRAIESSCHMEEHRLFSANVGDTPFLEWIPARKMVIRDVKSESLFETIGKIYNWLGLRPPNTYSLKREIAQNGGYLSGVLYLE